MIAPVVAMRQDPSSFLVVKAKLTPASTVIRNLICTDVKEASSSADRSLLIHNVPPLVNEKNLIAAFESVAAVEKAAFLTDGEKWAEDSSRIGYKKAVVTFKEASGLEALRGGKYEAPIVMSFPLTDARLVAPISLLADEEKRHQERIADLRAKADKIVEYYDEEMRIKEKIVKSTSGDVDEEGWQVVRRSRPDSLNREKALLSRNKLKEEKKKRIEENVADVYQYRMRNEKLGKLRLLRKKFEADKFKIAQMRAGRKFKPA